MFLFLSFFIFSCLFWTERGFYPKIVTAHMDGFGQKTIAEGAMVWPAGITVDYPARRIYWSDTKTQTIETALLNGKERIVVHKFSDGKTVI